jgi:A/G-specific adenine glycosylase
MESKVKKQESKTVPLRDSISLRSSLLAWYDEHRRDLPFRAAPGSPAAPYAVLVSEVMLQQTTVPAAIPYFVRWMERFPTVAELATAGEEEVLRLWEGLGYYSRARNLHTAAREIVARFGGKVPGTAAELRTLPGVGGYTAGAVASIAFGAREPALDANASRVLSRLFGASTGSGHRTFRTWRAVERHLARAARLLLPPPRPLGRPGDFNQALMDLGSSLCSPSAPRCLVCPLAPWCRTLRLGLTDAIPGPRPKQPVESFAMAVGLVVKGGKVLLTMRPPGGPFAGMWDFPAVRAKRRGAAAALAAAILDRTGSVVRVGRKSGEAPQSYTRFRVTLRLYPCVVERKGRKKGGRWVPLEELGGLGLPKASRAIARSLKGT